MTKDLVYLELLKRCGMSVDILPEAAIVTLDLIPYTNLIEPLVKRDKNTGYSILQIARKYNVTPAVIRRILYYKNNNNIVLISETIKK